MTGTLTAVQTAALVSALQRLFAVPVPPDLPERANDPTCFPRVFRSWLAQDYEWSRHATSSV